MSAKIELVTHGDKMTIVVRDSRGLVHGSKRGDRFGAAIRRVEAGARVSRKDALWLARSLLNYAVTPPRAQRIAAEKKAKGRNQKRGG